MKKIKQFLKKNETEIKVGVVIGITSVISYIVGQGKGYEKAIDSFNDIEVILYTKDGDEKTKIEMERAKE